MPFPSYEGNPGGPRVIDVGRPRRRRRRIILLSVLLVAILSASVVISWYVEALWFASLGFSSVFWRTLTYRGALFAAFAGATLLVLGGGFWAIKPRRLAGRTIYVNGEAVTLSLGPVVTIAGWV